MPASHKRSRGTRIMWAGTVVLLVAYPVSLAERYFRRRAVALDGRCAVSGCPGDPLWERAKDLWTVTWVLLVAGLCVIGVGAALDALRRRRAAA